MAKTTKQAKKTNEVKPTADTKKKKPEVTVKATPKTEKIIKPVNGRSEEHTSELPSRSDIVCRLLLEKTEVEIK